MNRRRLAGRHSVDWITATAIAGCLLLLAALGVVVTGLISELKGITDVTEAAFGALGVTWLVGQWVLAGLVRQRPAKKLRQRSVMIPVWWIVAYGAAVVLAPGDRRVASAHVKPNGR